MYVSYHSFLSFINRSTAKKGMCQKRRIRRGSIFSRYFFKDRKARSSWVSVASAQASTATLYSTNLAHAQCCIVPDGKIIAKKKYTTHNTIFQLLQYYIQINISFWLFDQCKNKAMLCNEEYKNNFLETLKLDCKISLPQYVRTCIMLEIVIVIYLNDMITF